LANVRARCGVGNETDGAQRLLDMTGPVCFVKARLRRRPVPGNAGAPDPNFRPHRFDDEELMICVVAGTRCGKAAARPSEFKACKRKRYSLFVLKEFKK